MNEAKPTDSVDEILSEALAIGPFEALRPDEEIPDPLGLTVAASTDAERIIRAARIERRKAILGAVSDCNLALQASSNR